MGQQPNVPLDIEDLPRRTPKPGAPQRWKPDRPGDLHGPDDVPWGGKFGTPGPDAGYAKSLAADREIPTLEGEHPDDVRRAVIVLAIARASHLGRAPVVEDLEAAEAALGVGAHDPTWRSPWVEGLAKSHSAERRLVAAVDPEALARTPEEIRRDTSHARRVIQGNPT